MHYDAWINARHLFIRPGKDVTKLVKNTYIDLNFLRSASESYVDVLNNPWFDRDVDRLSLRNVSEIPFRGYLIYLNGCLKGL